MGFRAVRCIVTFTLSFLVAPLTANAQQPTKVHRIGILMSGTLATQQRTLAAFQDGLREKGWIEGQNLRIEVRWADGKLERFADLAAELVRLKVDLLFTPSTSGTRAAQDATRTIPIVAIVGDPVGAGFVASLARPGGNITGLTPVAANTAKGLELLKELVPMASRVAVLMNPADQSNVAAWRETQAAAKALL